MSRFDTSDYSVRDIEDWVVEDPAVSDGYILCDPVDGQPLVDNRTQLSHPPGFLLENPRLRAGAALWQSSGTMAMYIMYSKGELQAHDLTPADPDMMPIEEVLQNFPPDVAAHTLDGATVGDYGLLEPLVTPGEYRPYFDRLDSAAELGDTALLCAGLEVDRFGRPATSTEAAIMAINAMAAEYTKDQTNDPTADQIAIAAVARSVSQSYRTLSLGHQIEVVNGMLPGGRVGHALLVAPVADAAYTHKFRSLGLLDVNGGVVDQASVTPAVIQRRDMTIEGRFRLTG